jgi:hypothetical protein
MQIEVGTAAPEVGYTNPQQAPTGHHVRQHGDCMVVVGKGPH